MEQVSFTCLAISTLCEPVFFKQFGKFWRKYIKKQANILPKVPELTKNHSPALEKRSKLGAKTKKRVGILDSQNSSQKGTNIVGQSLDFGNMSQRQSIGGLSGMDPNEPLIHVNMSLVSSDEDDFEKGDNQQKNADEIDIEDEHGFINIVKNDQAANKENDDSENEEMSL